MATRQLEALEKLSRLAARHDAGEEAIAEACAVISGITGASDACLFTGDGTTFDVFPRRENPEDYFGLAREAVMDSHHELIRVGGTAVYTITDGRAHGYGLPDGSHGGSHVAVGLWNGTNYLGSVIAHGPWTKARARSTAHFLQTASPALADLLERVVDSQRAQRVERQLAALSTVSRVFARSRDMSQVLDDVANAINSATGLLCSLDVLNAKGRIIARSTAASRFAGTPLAEKWMNMTKSPDPVRQIILKDPRPVLLPDLQNDMRISEEARDFYRSTAIVSAATFPLIFQDEVVALLRVGSLRPLAFEPSLVSFIQDLTAQAAVVVKGVQLWEDLDASRRETEKFSRRLQNSMQAQHHLARIDHLCGLPNRRYLDEVISAESARASRHGSRLSLAMADLDLFKRINDTYGHPAGDEALRQLAFVARSSCRKGDVVGRWGGDEFLFVMPSTDLEGAIISAERFRGTLERTPFQFGESQDQITASVGVAEADDECLRDLRAFVRRCDESLYEAKHAGRNVVKAYRRAGELTAV